MTLLRTEYEAALEPDGDAPSRATVNSLGSFLRGLLGAEHWFDPTFGTPRRWDSGEAEP
jgi:hypothetical protein